MKKYKLTAQQKVCYQTEGYVVLPEVFTQTECREFTICMMDLQAGRQKLDGFQPRQPDEWGRTHNQHAYDAVAMQWLVDPRLDQPLYDCLGQEADGIQTMYFWKGSEQRRHQDQFYLPSCMSAWIALQDVGVNNGTIYIQRGHTGIASSRVTTLEKRANSMVWTIMTLLILYSSETTYLKSQLKFQLEMLLCYTEPWFIEAARFWTAGRFGTY